MSEIEFEILKCINEDSNLNQRKLATMTGISLGKVNSILKKITDDGYIERILIKNSVKYIITDLGFSQLNNNLCTKKQIRLSIHQENESCKVKEAVILAAGEKEDFDLPVSMLKVDDFILIDRTLDILRRYGIEKIIIVGGYKIEVLKEHLKSQKDVTIIDNEKYSHTGTMYSLYKAKELVTDDFILLESDLIFEDEIIKKLTGSSIRDCIVLTDKSYSGDEAFVEIRDNYLFKISKDIHQLNSIDGEIVGVTKISFKLYEMMLEEFKNNKNPYISYEYTLLDVTRNYNVGFIKIDNLIWGEIDTKRQYNKIIKDVFPKIKNHRTH